MIYSVAVELGNDDSDFGVVVPDLKGCFSSGETFEKALINAKEAICFHLEGLAEERVIPPQPKPIESYLHNTEFKGWVWAVVEVDLRNEQLNKYLIEMRKMNEESRIYCDEARKQYSEATLKNEKKKWLEFGALLVLVGATITATKMFL